MKSLTILTLGLFVMLAPAAGRAQSVTNVWTGLDASDNASAAGNWSQGVPLETHHILLDGTGNKSLTWDASAVHTVASWTQTDAYSGTVTVATVYGDAGFTNLVIAGDCVISNGAWTHTANPNVDDEVNRLRVTVSGDLVVGSNAAIDVSGQGYRVKKGPGWGGGAAGSYGGRGSMQRGAGPCYGSAVTPTNLGSGGNSSAGGGAILMTVIGNVRNDGAIRANGGATSYYAGSGGSVYLMAGSLSGSGMVRADGGVTANYYAGGGGRIALVVTNAGADFSGFTGAISAYGGTTISIYHGGNGGTIYLEEGDDAPGHGELIVDNDGGAGDNYDRIMTTYYSVNASLGDEASATYEFRSITLTNSGILDVGPGYTLIVSNTTLVGTDGVANGIWLGGSTLLTAPDFAYSNLFIGVAATGSTFSPASSLTVGANAQLRIDKPHTMAADLTITNGGVLTHTLNNDIEEYKIDLTVDGSVTIGADGYINIDKKGLQDGNGPAGTGGGHGGRGTDTKLPYGSVVAPTNLGSGSSVTYLGGGAIRLDVTGTIRHDGVVNADGVTGASGGSIWFTAGSMTGTGTIRANSLGQAGGRIALAVTNAGADLSGFTGPVSAYGNGGGTIYTRTAAQGLHEGTLIVENSAVRTSGAEIGPYVTDAVVGNVMIRNNGYLVVEANESLALSGTWSNSATYEGKSGSQIIFTGGPTATSTVLGATSFMGLTSTNPAGKTILFEAGNTTTIPAGGRLRLAGAEGATNLLLRSTSDGSGWHLNVDGAADQYVASVDVQDSDASGGAQVVGLNSQDGGGNTNWSFLLATSGQTNVWTGSSNTIWSASTNWSLGRPPLEDDLILIPASMPHYPALDNGRTVAALEVENGASLALAGNDLTVNRNAILAGSITAAGAETLTFLTNVTFAGGTFAPALSTIVLDGSADQSVDLGGLTFHKVTVLNSAGTVSFGNGFSADELRCEAASGTRNLQFRQGETVTLKGLVLQGSTESTNILLRSSVDGQKWNMAVSGYRSVRGVDVKDSDAGTGLTIPAASSLDSSGNVNWAFGSVCSVWLGTSGADFNTAANWDPAGVPGAGARVLMDSANPMTIGNDVTLLDLTVGGSTNVSAVTVDAALTVIGNITVWTNGTLALNRPSVVSNAVYILPGGTLTHSVNPLSTEAHKLDVTVAGDMTIDVAGRVDVVGKGNGEWASNSSHGGVGHVDGPCYGSIVSPTNLGCSWNPSWPGGGAIRLTVSGTLRHDGAVYANGSDGDYRAGSGGSVFLTAGALTGTGDVMANGGTYSGHSGGGGGRIALIVTSGGSDFSSFTGSVQARSSISTLGPSAATCGAGTIYRQCPADGAGRGSVSVENGDYDYTGNTKVPPASHYTPGEASRAAFHLANSACLLLTTNYAVGDIWMDTANDELDLAGWTLRVGSPEHGLAGTVSNYGRIEWLMPGSVFLVR